MTRNSARWIASLLSQYVVWVLSAGAGEPIVSETATGWRIRNAHFAAEIGKDAGGLLTSLADSEGNRLLGPFGIYTDVGLYGERRYYGTRHETAPRVTVRREGEAIVVVSEGRLIRSADEKPDYPLIRYKAVARFDASAAMAVSVVITPEFDAKPPSAFVAHTVSVPDAPEIFAHTAEGLLCQDAATRSTRTWQSALDPLDPLRPFFGVCTRRRRCVVFTHIRSASGLGNVFYHESGHKSLTAFFAWRCGKASGGVVKGKPLDVSYTIRVLKNPAELGGMECVMGNP